MNQPSKSSHLRQIALFGGMVVTTATLALVAPGLSRSVRAALQDSPKAILDEAWQLVNQHYVDGTFNQVDWQATRQRLLSRNYTSKEQAYDALRVALKQLNDPYTRFMNAEEFATLTTQTSGELSGIGIRLGQDDQTKALVVIEPIAGSPAIKAGVRAGDQVLAIDGKPTSNMSIEEASALIRGKAGTKLVLRLQRSGQAGFDLTLTRAIIELPTVRYTFKREGADRIGYIRLNEFNAHAADQLRQAIQKLTGDGVEGFVLDLRGNPGGLLQASVEISRMWLDQGLIVSTVDRQGKNERIAADRTALTDLPLVVVVDGNSASSSEILTGALKDNQRAIVVGSPTFGKALVQSVHHLSDGSGLAITVAHYYTPKGTDISQKGITPDIAVNLTAPQRQSLTANPTLIATQSDPQYVQAVRSLKKLLLAQKERKQAAVSSPGVPALKAIQTR